METRAPYTLVGFLVMAAIGAVFLFVYWLNNIGGMGQRVNYEIEFENTVSSLSNGAAVLFNGIRVGEVVSLRLKPEEPRKIMVTIAVAAATPVRTDTHVGLAFQGLTGVPVIALEGRGNAPSPTRDFVLKADPRAGVSMTDAARDALTRLEGILADNATPLRETLGNLNTFSGALARNSDRLDGILAGIERLTGSGPAAAGSVFYDLTAPRDFPALKKDAMRPLTIPEPTAVLAFDTQKVLVRPSGGEDASFANARWADNIPKLLQARIIQSFENAGLLNLVARPMEGLGAELQLLIDIRSFQLSLSGSPQAELEFSAKIVAADGKVLNGQVFREAVPAQAINAPGAAAALDEAFKKAVVRLVVWASSNG